MPSSQTAPRAAVVGVALALLAATLGGRYHRARGGWELESGSNDVMTVMLLALGAVLAISFALLRPRAGRDKGGRLISIVWTVAIFVALVFTWRVIATSHRWVAEVGTAITSPQALEAFEAANAESFAPYDYRVPTG